MATAEPDNGSVPGGSFSPNPPAHPLSPASLDNVYSLVTGGGSLQKLRNNIGLGNTLSTLPVANGGTGLTSAPNMTVNLSSTSSANVFQSFPQPGVTGTLPVNRGGTGSTSIIQFINSMSTSDLQGLRSRLGLGNTLGVLDRAYGGTGNTSGAVPNESATWDYSTKKLSGDAVDDDGSLKAGTYRIVGSYSNTYGSSNVNSGVSFSVTSTLSINGTTILNVSDSSGPANKNSGYWAASVTGNIDTVLVISSSMSSSKVVYTAGGSRSAACSSLVSSETCSLQFIRTLI